MFWFFSYKKKKKNLSTNPLKGCSSNVTSTLTISTWILATVCNTLQVDMGSHYSVPKKAIFLYFIVKLLYNAIKLKYKNYIIYCCCGEYFGSNKMCCCCCLYVVWIWLLLAYKDSPSPFTWSSRVCRTLPSPWCSSSHGVPVMYYTHCMRGSARASTSHSPDMGERFSLNMACHCH